VLGALLAITSQGETAATRRSPVSSASPTPTSPGVAPLGPLNFVANEFSVHSPAIPAGQSPLNVDILQLRHSIWTSREGAPKASIGLMVQTPDGFLWLGTVNGLFRFDGDTFDGSINKRLPSTNITALLAEPNGDLWIGYEMGGSSRLSGGHVTNFDNHSTASVMGFSRAPDGTLYAQTSQAIQKLVGAQWQRLTPSSGYKGTHPLWMNVRSQALWVIDADGAYVLRPGAAQFEVVNREIAEAVMYGLPGNEPFPPQGKEIRASLVDSAGALWVISGDGSDGLRRYRWPAMPPGERKIQREQLGDQSTQNVRYFGFFEDRENNVWASSSRGLEQFSGTKFTPVVGPANFLWPALLPGDHGDLWISTDRHAYHLDHELIEVPSMGNGSGCISRDREGVIWMMANDGLHGLENGVVTTLPLPPNAKDVIETCQNIAGSVREGLWVSVARLGVYEWKDQKWIESGGRSDLPSGPAIRILSDDAGRLWFTYPNNRILVLDHGRTKLYTQSDGLEIGHVLGLYVRGDSVWASGERGVAQLRGARFETLRGVGDESFGATESLVETRAGELWLNSFNGVFRIAADEIKEVQRDPHHVVIYELFDEEDGLPPGLAPNLSPNPSVVEGTDGRIWVGVSGGLAWIDPGRILRNKVQPLVQVLSVAVGKAVYPPTQFLKLPSLTRNLRIHYTSPSLTMPDRVTFRYKLDGIDQEWQIGHMRSTTYYTNLGPGHYHFSVVATNEDGVSGPLQSLNFSILPAFYQTFWFKGLCGLFALLFLWLLFNRRVRLSNEQLQMRLEERHVERERIARELHDSVLQNLQWLLLKIKMWSDLPDLPETHRDDLSRTAAVTHDSLVQVRDKITLLRRSETGRLELANELETFGNELTRDSGVHFGLSLEGKPVPLTHAAYESIVDISRECIRNAFQHARSRHIDVKILYKSRSLRLLITDDGQGIDETVLAHQQHLGHWGIIGMHERSDLLKSHLSIKSDRQGGTAVSLEVPAHIVYTGQHRALFLRLFSAL
jgi:signal transduction histidine kinase/ligand-binding sensor domain-containing protein